MSLTIFYAALYEHFYFIIFQLQVQMYVYLSQQYIHRNSFLIGLYDSTKIRGVFLEFRLSPSKIGLDS